MRVRRTQRSEVQRRACRSRVLRSAAAAASGRASGASVPTPSAASSGGGRSIRVRCELQTLPSPLPCQMGRAGRSGAAGVALGRAEKSAVGARSAAARATTVVGRRVKRVAVSTAVLVRESGRRVPIPIPLTLSLPLQVEQGTRQLQRPSLLCLNRGPAPGCCSIATTTAATAPPAPSPTLRRPPATPPATPR
jgi:hypothetical protein